MRLLLVAALLLAVAACGGGHAKKLSFVPVAVPQYPQATAGRVVVQPQYQSTDFTLPAGTPPPVVYDWYVSRLSARGWKVTQRNETGLHAVRGRRTVDIGVRGRTLEINQQ